MALRRPARAFRDMTTDNRRALAIFFSLTFTISWGSGRLGNSGVRPTGPRHRKLHKQTGLPGLLLPVFPFWFRTFACCLHHGCSGRRSGRSRRTTEADGALESRFQVVCDCCRWHSGTRSLRCRRRHYKRNRRDQFHPAVPRWFRRSMVSGGILHVPCSRRRNSRRPAERRAGMARLRAAETAREPEPAFCQYCSRT